MLYAGGYLMGRSLREWMKCNAGCCEKRGLQASHGGRTPVEKSADFLQY